MRRLLSALSMGLAALVIATGMLVAVPAVVSAATNPYQGVCQNGGGASSVCNTGTDDPIAGPNGAIVAVTTIIAIITGIVAVIFLVIGGLKYVTSNGDSSSVSSAKSTIIAALIGLVIAAMARPVVSFVVSRL